MSMGFKDCMACSGEAEALHAVDGMIEYYCHECGMSWSEEPDVVQDTAYETFMLRNYGEVV